MENKTTTMKQADGRVTTLNRAKVEEFRTWYATEARRNADRAPSATDREMGLDRADIRAQSVAYASEAARLTKVLACIDAGTPELPPELYPAR
jgi:hypothetical protein